MHHGEIILFVTPPAHFRRLELLPEQELLQDIVEAFEDSWHKVMGKEGDIQYTPIFTHALTEEPGRLRIKSSTETVEDLKLLEEYSLWAREICCPLESTKGYQMEANVMLDAVKFSSLATLKTKHDRSTTLSKRLPAGVSKLSCGGRNRPRRSMANDTFTS